MKKYLVEFRIVYLVDAKDEDEAGDVARTAFDKEFDYSIYTLEDRCYVQIIELNKNLRPEEEEADNQTKLKEER